MIAVNEPSKHATLYVSTSGEPYPIKLVSAEKKGAITFDRWNEPFTVTRPAKSIDFNNLKALVGG